MLIQSYKNTPKLEVKYRSFYLSLSIIKFLENLNLKTSSRIISDQLIRSITSIGANIIEAKASSSKKEFINYFHIALKSCNESKYWLALLREIYPERKEEITAFIKEAEEIGKIIGSSILTMKGKRNL